MQCTYRVCQDQHPLKVELSRAVVSWQHLPLGILIRPNSPLFELALVYPAVRLYEPYGFREECIDQLPLGDGQRGFVRFDHPLHVGHPCSQGVQACKVVGICAFCIAGNLGDHITSH